MRDLDAQVGTFGASREVRVDQLIGRPVLDAAGERMGHILDICAGDDHGEFVVRHYVVGGRLAAPRLSVGSVLLRMLRLIGLRVAATHYVIPWDQLDCSDPERPRARLEQKELAK
jgi:hypothetical protein